MKKATVLLVTLLLMSGSLTLQAQITETNSFTNLNETIPDGNSSGLHDVRTITSAIAHLSSVRLKLRVIGEFNGDLYGYVRHIRGGTTNFCVLLNRVGRTATNSAGYADAGFDVAFDEAAAAGDIHIYRTVTNPPSGAPLSGIWQPDGRRVDPEVVVDSTARTATLSSFTNADGNGEWTLYLADLAAGGTNMLVNWELQLTGIATPAVTWPAPGDIVYGAGLGSAQLNASSPVPGTFTYSPLAGAVLNAGSNLALSVTFKPTDTNSYASVTTNVSINVLKAPLTITALSTNKVYGASVPVLSASYSGFVNGDTTNALSSQAALSTTATAASPAGSYSITASGASSTNYTIAYVAGTLTVTPAALTITALNTNKVYGAPVPVLSASYSGFVNGDTTNSLSAQAALSTTATAASPAGSYGITASGASSTNYTIAYVGGTLTVTPAALTITALNTNKVYGAPVPVLSASYSGFVNGDTTNALSSQAALSTTATAVSPAGSYSITANGASSTNYTIAYVGGTLTVTPAALTITALNTNKVYGAPVPVLSASYSGFVNGDTTNSLSAQAALSTTATVASPAGIYSITASGASSTNYTISYVAGTLTVTPAGLTITALNTNKVYGAAVPVLSGSYSGFVNGDTTNSLSSRAALSTSATAASPVGSYSITASGASSTNYTISYVTGTLTVTPAALTITALNTNKVYGAPVPVLSASYSGFVNGDTTNSLSAQAALSTTATAASPAGIYSITANGASSTNYTISYVAAILTVTPAGLTITALNTNKVYGAPVPVLSASYSGFVNGDTTNSLSVQAALSTTATAASPVGSYSITASGASSTNYTIAYVGGTLTVTRAGTIGTLISSRNPSPPGQPVAFTFTLNAVAPGAGTPTGTAQFRIDGTYAGGPVSLSGGVAGYSTTNLAHGTHTVVAEYAGDGNFTGTTNLLSPAQLINTPPVAGPYTAERDPTNGVKVSVGTLLSNCSDTDGDPISFLGVSATSANGGTVVSNGGWVFYTPAPGFTNSDTFTYTISDGWGAPVTGTVTVNIRIDNGPSSNLTITDLGNGSYAVRGDGIPGRSYRIQFADTAPPTNWLTLGPASADPFGIFQFNDTNGSPQRFYRSVYP